MNTPIWRRYLRLLGTDIAADVDDELQFHLAMRTDELVEQGCTPEAARKEAERLFGDVKAVASECRRLGQRRLRAKRYAAVVGELGRDVGFALRMAMKRKVYSTVIVASLALGIGLNIAAFTIVKSAVLDSLPVDRPEELVLFKWTSEKWPGLFALSGWVRDTSSGGIMSSSFSYSAYQRFANRDDIFSSVFAFAPISRFNTGLDGEALLTSGQMVSGSFFPALGIRPSFGRLIGPGDDRRDSEAVAVLSHTFWRRRLHSDPSVLGRSITLNGFQYTVIGVAPVEFNGTLQVGDAPDIYVPLAHYQGDMRRENALEAADFWFLRVMGRLQPGVDPSLAQSMLAPILDHIVEDDLGVAARSDGEFDQTVPSLALVSGARALDERREDIVGPLTAAVGVTVLVLLIACTNAATLFLAGTVARRREIAIRLSLGAGRARLIRQLMTETLVLACAGGALGLVSSLWLSRGLLTLMPSRVGAFMVLDLRPDLGVVTFAVLVSMLTGVVFGFIPATRMLRVQPARNLQHDGARGGHSRSVFRLGKVLLAGQVALSLVLLVVAGLFARTVGRLVSVDTGFAADGVLMFQVDPALNGYESDGIVNFCEEIKNSFEMLPGAAETTFSTFSLVSGSGSWDRLSVSDEKKVGTFVGAVDPDFLRTMQIQLLQGRNLHASDRADTPLVAIVNETFVREAFGGGKAVGREFSSGDGDERRVFRIVGVFQDGNSISLHDELEATAYIPYPQAGERMGLSSVTFYVRTTTPTPVFADSVRNAAATVDQDLPVFEMKMLSQQISDAMGLERSFLLLSGVGAAFALALSCIGLFGTVSYSLGLRIREIGIRMTLGATRRGILLSAYRELDVVAFGIVLGLVAAVLTARWIDDLFFELTATDPITLAAAALVMMSVGALAVYLPARRATRVDPMEVLRAD